MYPPKAPPSETPTLPSSPDLLLLKCIKRFKKAPRCLISSPMMNINCGFAIGFFSIFGAILVVSHVPKLCRKYGPPTSRWMVGHVLLPRIFHSRHMINPSRVEVLCHLLHWTAVIVYNTWNVDSLGQAALRAGLLAIIHVVPLLITYQLGFVSSVLGISLNLVGKLHQSLAVMVLVQRHVT